MNINLVLLSIAFYLFKNLIGGTFLSQFSTITVVFVSGTTKSIVSIIKVDNVYKKQTVEIIKSILYIFSLVYPFQINESS